MPQNVIALNRPKTELLIIKMQYLAHHIVSLPCTYTLIRNSISIIENACSQNHY